MQRWPKTLWIVRHGQSAGNVARDKASAAGLAEIELPTRDVDVPLSDLGIEQAQALGSWFAALPQAERPEAVISSPYVRAQQTAQAVIDAGGVTADFKELIRDERLREKEFGILDRLTRHGIKQRHPEQAALRSEVGKFYHRPPGGESWCDVILRLRSALDTISIHYEGKNVVLVAHQVVVLCMRYLIENMDEETVLTIDAQGDVANCGITEYAAVGKGNGVQLKLQRYNFVAPLERSGTPVTSRPDANVAAR